MSVGMYDEMIKEIIADTIKSYKAKSEIDVEAIRKGENDEHLTQSSNSNNQQVSEEEQKRREDFERKRQEIFKKLLECRNRMNDETYDSKQIEETKGIKKYH